MILDTVNSSTFLCNISLVSFELAHANHFFQWVMGRSDMGGEAQFRQFWKICFRHLIVLRTDRILSPSTDFERPKQGPNCAAATFHPKGVCSPMYHGLFTFYCPSQYLFSFPSNLTPGSSEYVWQRKVEGVTGGRSLPYFPPKKTLNAMLKQTDAATIFKISLPKRIGVGS